MRKVLTCIVMLMAIAITAPAQGKRKMAKLLDSWLDHHKSEIYQSWGPPNAVTSDGKDGEVLIYSDRKYTSGYYIMQTWIPPSDTYLHKMLYVNKDGIIYYWRWQRNANPPQQVHVEGNINVYNR